MTNIENKITRKVAIFHCGFIYSGGGERIVLEEAIGLKKKEYEVVVYAPTLDNKKCFPHMVRELDVRTFISHRTRFLPGGYALNLVLSSLLAPFFAYNFRDVDIFVGANQPSAWIAFCIAKILRKPYIVYLNQPNRVVYPRPVDLEYGWATTVKDYHRLFKLFHKALRPVISWLDKSSIQHADNLLVNGKYIGDIIENIYAKKTVDAPAGAYAYPLSLLTTSPQVYKGSINIAGQKINKPYALITNRHDPQKRFDYVIEALAIVLKTYKNAKLVIPGPFTDHTKNLKILAKKLGIEDKVIFLGQIKEDDLKKLYRHTSVYCYPSPEEDFGLGPLEAGGWGVPTVAWNHGGPTVTVDNGVTGLLAKPYDIKNYAKHMLTLFNDPRLRARMGKAAWKRTKNEFSWEKHIDTIESVINELI
ncbi:glycosyltransferase family 4 protein [Candidatus Woesebacteria bacterium]|nr:MAG: glycosyltransferase family 4 protein [Candidatus Woesebacteria bacterium]